MEQIPSIDFSKGLGPAILGILAFVVPLAIRTFLKDRSERKEKVYAVLQQCARSAYNTVQNRLKRGDTLEDKQQAGLEALDRLLTIRRGTPATQAEKEQACLLFDAIHGELCPGGTGTPSPRTDGPIGG